MVYPIVYIDAMVFNMRENNVIRKAAAYGILGINEEGRKEELSITIGENESAKFWQSVLNELKNRDMQDISWRLGNLRKSGPCPFGTGGRSTRSWILCIPAG